MRLGQRVQPEQCQVAQRSTCDTVTSGSHQACRFWGSVELELLDPSRVPRVTSPRGAPQAVGGRNGHQGQCPRFRVYAGQQQPFHLGSAPQGRAVPPP